jgi:hypothetical protein
MTEPLRRRRRHPDVVPGPPGTSLTRYQLDWEMRRVDDAEEGLATLCRELRDDVLAGRYGVIVGDDTSGRLPALVLRTAFNIMRAREGLPKLPVYFLPGGGGRIPRAEAAAAELAAMGPQLVRASRGARALVVTDFIDSGSSVLGLIEGCRALGIEADCAALAVASDSTLPQRLATAGSKLLFGRLTETPPLLDGAHMISGVEKLPARASREPNVVATAHEARRRGAALARELADRTSAGGRAL